MSGELSKVRFGKESRGKTPVSSTQPAVAATVRIRSTSRPVGRGEGRDEVDLTSVANAPQKGFKLEVAKVNCGRSA